MQAKAEVDLPEMIIACENVYDAEILQDDHAGEIDEGYVRLVLVLLPQGVGKRGRDS